MEDQKSAGFSPLCHFRSVFASYFRRMALRILAVGPVPKHIAIIMDGNRRFADRYRMKRSRGHLLGYEGLISTLENCLELGVKYVTVYAFSIDNFARPEEEVNSMMGLMEEKLNELIEKVQVVKDFGVRVQILGDLTLLPTNVQAAAERAMVATKENRSVVLNLCVSYTSTSEIVHSIQEIRDNLLKISCATKPCTASADTCQIQSHWDPWRGTNGFKSDIFRDQYEYEDYNSGCLTDSNVEIRGKQKADVLQHKTQINNGHGIYEDMSLQNLVNGVSHDEARQAKSSELENGKIDADSHTKLSTQCLCSNRLKEGSDFLKSKGPQAMIEAITVKEIDDHLYTAGCPPPDILIRTSGETRLSNFLLWQGTSYSRLVFCKVLWPEFSLRHLIWIILDYQRAFPALQKQRQLQEQLLAAST